MFFSQCAENKVGALFRHVAKFGLSAFQKTLSGKTT